MKIQSVINKIGGLLSIILLFCATNLVAQETSGAQTSSNGIFSLTKQSNVSSFPAGGGSVTYTYTVQNLTGSKIFFVSGSDNKCSPVSATTPLQSEQGSGETVYFINANASATWSCTTTLSETTTNTASFTFAAGHRRTGFIFTSFEWVNEGTATASITVQRELPVGALSCNTLWYSSDEYFGYNGRLVL